MLKTNFLFQRCTTLVTKIPAISGIPYGIIIHSTSLRQNTIRSVIVTAGRNFPRKTMVGDEWFFLNKKNGSPLVMIVVEPMAKITIVIVFIWIFPNSF